MVLLCLIIYKVVMLYLCINSEKTQQSFVTVFNFQVISVLSLLKSGL